MTSTLTPSAYLFAHNYCDKYFLSHMNEIVINSFTCETLMITKFFLVQFVYNKDTNTRTFYGMYFDAELWDKKLSTCKEAQEWFKECNREFKCDIHKVRSLKNFFRKM